MVNTFGPLFLPQIYGSNMTAFEIASSGTIALTAKDVFSLQMDRNLAASNVILSTLCNDSLLLSVNAGNTSLAFDGNSNDVNAYAACNINLAALHDVKFTASNNATLVARSNVNIGAQTQSIVMSAASSNVKVTFDAPTQSLLTAVAQYARTDVGNSIYTAASNAIYTTANSNAYLAALNGSMQLAASNSNMVVLLDAATLSLIHISEPTRPY